jgi:hypothetical protein
MFRIVIIAIVLVACGNITRTPPPVAPAPAPIAPAAAPKPAPPPVNLVCKKFEKIDAKATCEPELTDEGQAHIHTATVTTGGQMLSCRQDTSLLGMMCGNPITDVRPVPKTEDAKPDASGKAVVKAKPGAKK